MRTSFDIFRRVRVPSLRRTYARRGAFDAVPYGCVMVEKKKKKKNRSSPSRRAEYFVRLAARGAKTRSLIRISARFVRIHARRYRRTYTVYTARSYVHVVVATLYGLFSFAENRIPFGAAVAPGSIFADAKRTPDTRIRRSFRNDELRSRAKPPGLETKRAAPITLPSVRPFDRSSSQQRARPIFLPRAIPACVV